MSVSVYSPAPAAAVRGLTAGQVVYGSSVGGLGQEAGFEYNSSTNTLTVANATVSGLTATRIPYSGAGGALSDDAHLTWTAGTDTLTASNVNASSALTSPSVTDSGLTATRVVFAGTGGLLSDDAHLTWTAGTDTLTSTNVSVGTALSTASATVSGLSTVGALVYAGSGGLLAQADQTYTASTTHPVSTGVAAPIGSIHKYTTDGTFWRKVGSANTSWTRIGTATTATVAGAAATTITVSSLDLATDKIYEFVCFLKKAVADDTVISVLPNSAATSCLSSMHRGVTGVEHAMNTDLGGTLGVGQFGGSAPAGSFGYVHGLMYGAQGYTIVETRFFGGNGSPVSTWENDYGVIAFTGASNVTSLRVASSFAAALDIGSYLTVWRPGEVMF